MEHPTRKSLPRKVTAGRRVAATRRSHKEASALVTSYVKMVSRALPAEVIEMERAGVPGVLIKELCIRINVTRQRMYEIIGAPKATIERKASANATVNGTAGQATLGVLRLLAQARGIVERSTAPEARSFDVEKWLGEWIETPQPALGGRKPADMLDTPTGLAIVVRTLGALESGVYL